MEDQSKLSVEQSTSSASNDAPSCDFLCVHPDVVDKVYDNMPAEESLYDLAELFKVFGDGTRLKIIYALLQKELCVCDICEIVEMSQSSVSHQLRLLKTTGLVKYRKEGKTVFYS